MKTAFAVLCLSLVCIQLPSAFAKDENSITLAERRKTVSLSELTLEQKKTLLLSSRNSLIDLQASSPEKQNQTHQNYAEIFHQLDKNIETTSTVELVGRLGELFNANNDFHTDLLLPKPYATFRSYLPIYLYLEKPAKNSKYKWFVGSVLKDQTEEVANIDVGDELISVNGVAIKNYIARTLKISDFNTTESRIRAATKLIHYIAHSRRLFPVEDFVTLIFKKASGEMKEAKLSWLSTTTTSFTALYKLDAVAAAQENNILGATKLADTTVSYKQIRNENGVFTYVQFPDFNGDYVKGLASIISGASASGSHYRHSK